MKPKLDLELDTKDHYYRMTKNKNGYLVRQKMYKKSKDAIYKSTDISEIDEMISEIDLDDIIAKNQIKEKLSKIFSLILTPKEEKIIRMRFGIGLNSDYTLYEIAHSNDFEVTPSRIAQHEAKALRKLRHFFSGRGKDLKGYFTGELDV